MVDTVSKKQRSEIMSKIRGHDTKIEVALRSFLFRAGFRFKKNVKSLPGTPDIVFPKYRTVVFVDGCFWHGHYRCADGHIPRTNSKYWRLKIAHNKKRDKKQRRGLRRSGWKVLSCWECEVERDLHFVASKIIRLLMVSCRS